ncbi:acyltransferase family protein [Haemophilus influenzae]|uniref:acyltransferase family protein n=1 Tax=Haemophilus influenzae TaxID=727 RepID=UPI00211B9C92|nr:acyltransferase [Haemophilus influenzae]
MMGVYFEQNRTEQNRTEQNRTEQNRTEQNRTEAEFITKEQSFYIRGCAVILMLIHHLFTFSDRIPKTAEIIWLFGDNQFEVSLGTWGKYCVAIFLFISGYGYSFSKDKPMKYYTNKLVALYRTVFIIFLIYIPIDIYFNVERVVSDLSLKSILMNLIGFHSNYNGEWWFLFPYVLFVLITPILNKFRYYLASLFVVGIILHNMQGNGIVGEFFTWSVAYILGFIFGVLSPKLAHFKSNAIISLFLSIVCYFIIKYGMDNFGIESSLFLVPFVIFIIKTLYNIIPLILRKGISSIGKKCLIIWLVHSFYCYHFAGEFIYSPKYSILILLNLLLISYLSAVLITFIEKKLVIVFVKIRNIIFQKVNKVSTM